MATPHPPIPGHAEHQDHPADYSNVIGVDLLARWSHHRTYWDMRLASNLDFSLRTTLISGAETRVLTRGKEILCGVNLSTLDPLALANHPLVRAAAIDAAGRWGVHSSGPLSLQGGSPPLMALEERIADTLCCEEATVFPTSWAAGYGTVRVLARSDDHVIFIEGSSGGLLEGAKAATRHIHRVAHGNIAAVADRLTEIRSHEPHCGILVITPAVSAIESAVTDLRSLRAYTKASQANLLVDVSNDFGAVGDRGLGYLGVQAMVGEADIVVGSLESCFASNGGFVAAAAYGFRQALSVFAPTLANSSALSPMHAAAALAAFEIVQSVEGARRRIRLIENVQHLHDGLAGRAFNVLGIPTTSVPVVFNSTVEARLMTSSVLTSGAVVNLLEHPEVQKNQPRWLLLPTADHTAEQLYRFITIAVAAREVDEAFDQGPT